MNNTKDMIITIACFILGLILFLIEPKSSIYPAASLAGGIVGNAIFILILILLYSSVITKGKYNFKKQTTEKKMKIISVAFFISECIRLVLFIFPIRA